MKTVDMAIYFVLNWPLSAILLCTIAVCAWLIFDCALRAISRRRAVALSEGHNQGKENA